MIWEEPCDSCNYATQACAYIMNGKNMDDACISELRWLKYKIRHNEG
jgi:hypothetical protein